MLRSNTFVHRILKTATKLRKQKPKCLNDDNNVVKDDGLSDWEASEDEGLGEAKDVEDTDDLGDDDAEDDNLGDDDNVVKDDGLGDVDASEDEGLGEGKAVEDTDDLGDNDAEDVTEDDDNLGDDDNVVKDDGLGDGEASEDEGLGVGEAVEDIDDLGDDYAEDVIEDNDNLGNADVDVAAVSACSLCVNLNSCLRHFFVKVKMTEKTEDYKDDEDIWKHWCWKPCGSDVPSPQLFYYCNELF